MVNWATLSVDHVSQMNGDVRATVPHMRGDRLFFICFQLPAITFLGRVFLNQLKYLTSPNCERS
jgi:hypothetical protein